MWWQYIVYNDYVLKWLECYKLFSCCLTKLYVFIICDACIILDGILGIQSIIVLISFCHRRDRLCFNPLADDVWGNEYGLTDAFSDKVESWD